MFPGLTVIFALGLYDIAVWHVGLIDHGPRDVLIVEWGPEKHFLPWA